MKNRRFSIVFASVSVFYMLVFLVFSFFATFKSVTPSEERYMELADFQYGGSSGGGGEAAAAVPVNASRPASAPAPQNEIVDPSLPPDTEPSSTDGNPSSASAADSGFSGTGVAGTGSGSGSGDGTGSGFGSGDGAGDGDNPDYVPMQNISQLPVIPERFLRSRLEYPEMARRSGIMGRVFLELFLDSKGRIRKIEVLKEDPVGYGFADAAVRAFDGCACVPAKMNGEAVAVRFRYPIRFSLN
jgi:protein TonB